MAISSTPSVWDVITEEAAGESRLWSDALLADREREPVAVFSPLSQERFALGLETIYEGYLVHYGRPRLFAPADADTALLLGDYLYAHGLVRVAGLEPLGAVADLAELIALCAQLRAEGGVDDGPAWAATAALLGVGALESAREAIARDGDGEPLLDLARSAAGATAVEESLAAHHRRVK